jgi:hypothetical protein
MKLICLANSRKLSGHCVAGKEFDGDQVERWIRPVGGTPSGELHGRQCQYGTGGQPVLLDIIELDLGSHVPHGYQTENHGLGTGRWTHAGSVSPNHLQALADSPASLWTNGYRSGGGLHDRIPELLAQKLTTSLALVQVDAFHYHVEPNPFKGNALSVRGEFRYNGVDYSLKVTDPIAEDRAFKLGVGRHHASAPWLTVSLGEPFDDYVYKLIAAVFQ